MDKIVIVTSEPKPNDSLLGWLNALFPDCETQIVFSKIQTFEQSDTNSAYDPMAAKKTGRA